VSATKENPRVLVVGGGITGITAAVEASEAGADVVLVEKGAFLGGRVARSHQYFPKLCPPTCGLEISFRRLRTSPRIRVLTLAEVESVSGSAGNFRAVVRRRPRFVNDLCTGCGACVDVCPEERADDFNAGMGRTKAVYLAPGVPHPAIHAIDAAACKGTACGKCVPACAYGAIDLAMQPATETIEAGSVVWATGWSPPDASRLEGLGFGVHKDVVTNVMMERMAARTGPTQGRIVRPSDGKAPRSVAFLQCAGSRDVNYQPWCSGVCCMASLKQARYVRQQCPEAEVFVFYIDIRAPGRMEDFFEETTRDARFHLVRGKAAKVTQDGGELLVEAEDTFTGEFVDRKVDLVVLATGMAPAGAGGAKVEGGLLTDEFGFLADEQPVPGMLAAGCAKRPTDVASCVRDATGAVIHALAHCGGGAS
jgi:quinone-modifying oxidoreductase subunit QmoA